MWSYQYRKSHCGDKMVIRSSYLHNGNSYTGKTSLYWIRAQVMEQIWIRWMKWILKKYKVKTKCHKFGFVVPIVKQWKHNIYPLRRCHTLTDWMNQRVMDWKKMSSGEIVASFCCPLDIWWIKAFNKSTLFHVHWLQFHMWVILQNLLPNIISQFTPQKYSKY